MIHVTAETIEYFTDVGDIKEKIDRCSKNRTKYFLMKIFGRRYRDLSKKKRSTNEKKEGERGDDDVEEVGSRGLLLRPPCEKDVGECASGCREGLVGGRKK